MYRNEVIIEPQLELDSSSSMSKSDNMRTINIDNVINITHGGATKSESTKVSSPTPSVRSTSISISSIESDAASSVIDSDVDEYEDTKTGCMVKKLGQQTANHVENNPVSSISPEIAVMLGQQIERDVSSTNGPNIASLSLTNSTDVTFGHKKYHRGPVTIQQILMEKPSHQGNSNPAFDGCSSTTARTKEPERGTHIDNPPPWQPYKNILNHKAALITAILVISTLVIGILVIIGINVLHDGVLLNVGGSDDEKSQMLISRNDWVAQPANVELQDLETPALRVIISSTKTQNCTTTPMCILRTRLIQTYDMESKSFDDIRSNFLVGGDGKVYVGRGWNKVGAHTKGFNEDSVGVALIGTFNKWAPDELQLNATKWLLSEGVRLNKLDADFKLYSSGQFDINEQPGEALFDIIKTWPNWSNL